MSNSTRLHKTILIGSCEKGRKAEHPGRTSLSLFHPLFRANSVIYNCSTRQEQEDFLQEAQTIAHLEHPNIVRLLDYGIENNVPFLVMGYAPNGTVRQHSPRGVPLLLPLIISSTKQLASALQYAHDEHIIHRDIKPENMLIGRHNQLLLSDFGIALVAHSEQSLSTQNVVGTPAYMAPEQFMGKPRPASDQYSLGIVVYEWLCGERPFTQGDLGFQHNYAPPPSLQQKRPGIPLEIEQVVMKALAKEPHHRFASIQEFASMLEAAYQASLSLSSQDQSKRLSSRIPLQLKRKTIRTTFFLLISIFLVITSLSSLLLVRQSDILQRNKTPPVSVTAKYEFISTHVPTTQTSCPSQDIVRTPITASITAADGSSDLVYVVNGTQGLSTPFSTLERYNTATRKKSEIVRVNNANIGEAQISASGQWILFTVITPSPDMQSKLQMIRIDGQGSQTLYCTPQHLTYIQWSPDQRFVSFGDGTNIFILDMQKGRVFQILQNNYFPQVWGDNNFLYVSHTPADSGPADLYSVYISGDNPSLLNDSLDLVFQQKLGIEETPCWDSSISYHYDSNGINSKLFISQCVYKIYTTDHTKQSLQGPSTISLAQFNSLQAIFTSQKLAITQMSAGPDSTYLFTTDGFIANTPDTQNNGLWKLEINGSGAPTLKLLSQKNVSFKKSHSVDETPWSVFSRNGIFYSVTDDKQNLFIGSLDGGELRLFASASGETKLSISGWAI